MKQKNKIANALKHLSKNDNTLSTLIKKIGTCNLQPRRKYFNLLVRSIVGQQLSVTAANAISKKFFDYFNQKPTPEKLIKTSHEVLRSLGLSNAKARYVKDLSQKIIDGKVSLKNISRLSDEQIIEELTKVKGIGIWTAHMFLIFTLGRFNVLPYSDLGIRKAVMLNYGLRKLPNEKKIFKLSKENNWHPYCSVACLYLWESLDKGILIN